MDNKDTQQVTANNIPPKAPVAPVTPSSSTPIGGSPVPATAKVFSSKMMWIIIIAAVILIIGGGTFWYLSQSRQNSSQVTPVATPTVSQSPQDKTMTDLKSEVDGLTISDPSTDFTAIDQDLSSL